MPDVALITCSRGFHPEDHLLTEVLASVGLSSAPLIWDEPCSLEFRAYWMRSAWDYTEKPAQFLDFLSSLQGRLVFNSVDLMIWNHHKSYLTELAPLSVPTEVFAQGAHAGETREGIWIAKPAIGAGSRGARKGPWSDVGPHLELLVSHQDAVLQPYYSSVDGYGERSLLFVEGEFAHAVQRRRALVEAEDPSRLHECIGPSAAELRVARATLERIEPTLYARVDLLPDDRGEPRVLELEVIEPQLFLREAPETAEKLARAVKREIAGR